MEEYSLTKDSKYRSFMLAIDKALRAFDYTTEWADLIAALGKLNKVLLAHMKYPIIPRRILISKRLAQCMHPALPTGVHLKALETYDIIFKSMGTNRLAQELFLYSAGLFPLMGNAAMSVRPQLLTIFETHFVSLGHRLRPGLNGIITGILPGLEEGSDHFDRLILFQTRGLIWKKNLDIVGEALCQSVQDTNVLVQRSTLELLTHMFPIHDPKLSNLLLINVMTSSLYVILRRDMSLNRRLFSWLIGHEDNNSNDCMKFTSDNYSYYFQHYTQQCLTESLIQFLKKSVQSPNMDLKPFRLLMTLFEKPVISSFILDDLIIEILRTLYHFDHKYCKSDSNEVAGSSPSAGKSRDDFVRTTNLLLGSFEMQLIWKFCGDYFEKVFKSDFRINDSLIIPVNQIGSSSISVAEISQLIIFLLETLSIDTYVTTHSYELPNLFKKIVNALLIEHKHLKSEEIILTFSACRRILSKVHPIISENMDDISSINDENEPSFESLVYSCSNTFGELFSALFSEYFFSDDNRLECLFLKTCLCITRKSNQQASNLDGMLLEHSTDDDEDENTNVFKVQETDRNFENLLEELKCTCVRTKNNGNDYIDVLTAACNILMDLSSLTLNHPLEIGSNDAEDNNKRNIPLWLMHLILSSCFLHEDFFGDAASNSKRKITLKLVPDSKLKLIAEETVISQIIGWRLWNGLASNGVFDLQCVDLLHKLHIAIPHEDLMEKKAMSQISESESLKLDYFKKFTLFWRLSRDIGLKLQDSRIAKIFDFCLYKLLDNLNADIGPLKTQSQCWILHAITHGDILRVFEPLFLQLLNPDSARISVLHAKIYTTDTIDAEKASKAFKRMDLYQNTTVYAIHPREGDIKYHISGDLSELNQSKKMKHALYLSSFEDKKSCSEDIFSKTENFNLSTLSSNILVNPFALVPNSCNSHSSYTFGFSHDEPNSCIVDNIIDDILEDVVDTNSTSSETSSLSNSVVVHPLHSHILIYTQVFDSKLILYTLKCIKNIILTNPRVIVCTLSTSNLSSVKSLRNNDLQNLLAKHRKSIFGNNFFGRISDEDLKTYRNASLIEIMMSLCLYFIRSYYPNLGYTRLTPEEIVGNRNIQLLSVEIMVMIVSELIHLVSVNGKAYASFVNDLLNRFKVQKIILHSLLTSVHDSNRYSKKQNTYFTDEILNFNNVGCDNVSFDLYLATYNEAFQKENLDNTVIDSNHERKRSIVSLLSMKYVNDLSIPEQPLFLTAIISALSQSKIRHIHSYWTSFVISSLPFLGESLNYIVSEVMGQIIANVEEIILKHHPDKLPTDYIVNQIEALTAIIHYCLVDVSSDSKPFDTKSTQYIDSGTIFNNLLHAFSSKSNNSGMAHHYASHFVSAVAITWQEIKCVEKVVVSFPEAPNSGHEVLINFVESVHTMPISNIINTLRSIIKSPPLVIGVKWKNDIQVLVLQFFYSYMSKFSALALSDSWTELALLTKECLGLNPPAIFLSLAILNQFVLRGKKMSEKKDVKEIQDLAGKIVDQCAAIGGSRLETKTWLQRNFVMSRDVQVLPESNEKDKNDSNSTNALHPYAVTALNLLGDILANFLDVIYQSDEKEKVLPLLQTVMSNVIPYTRNHTQTNRNCFIACSRLLSGLSEYQYTRKAWRKEVFELLMEPSFFQMDYECFPYWKVIVDNMMTHDNTTFKELMTKLGSIGQSGSLNLFTNKDAEIEQKALCLKRLAFVIFCADTDQYYRYMPDIQERLAECLRMVSNTPEIQSVVFLCFRVILLRMSQQHLTSLWPLIITEMVQIFSYMEHELSTDTEEWSSHLKQMSLLDTGWLCKLLDLTLVLPAQRVPQFQMYRWAFINEGGEGLLSSQSNVDEDAIEISNSLDFVPYVVRVAKLLITPDKQVEPFIRVKGSPLLTMKSISSLNNLRPFFNAVCLGNSPQKAIKLYNSPSDINEKAIDDILIKDFIESFVPLKVAG
ncbi:Protein pad-1 [Lepeophtheirus salmonis]|uniref:Protein pad-1 n=1 Tax=Lepeophtheirus salmonis TaxID=72036 RepID=A0A7R8D6C3_LEPSM|nr:Protein pad-1 [Lepeophtheirus salmonis]CAF3043457.1 Protein pad-1 [Lepeophtheirus salmonis]